MKLFLLAIGGRERASSRLRVWDHIDALRAAGHEVAVDSVVAQGAAANDLRFVMRLVRSYASWLRRFLRADAVVLQETMILWPALLLKNLGKRRRVVFDFSDPVDRVGKRLRAAVPPPADAGTGLGAAHPGPVAPGPRERRTFDRV